MPAKGNNLSRNPNICASCSSLIDGEGEIGESGHLQPSLEAVPPEKSQEISRAA